MSDPVTLSPIPAILDDLRRGRAIILVDDEDRENEGDLVCAAEAVTPELINFMTRHTPGYLCVALTAAECDRLELHPQTVSNTALRGTAMAVSVDGHPRHGVGTGISASDRARTARLLADAATRPDDLVRPGHMVPLRARDGGVLVRTGQTEGSVDLMRLAGLHPAAVISEVCREDGEMARMPELLAFAREHALRICSVEQIIHYRLRRERLVHRLPPQEGVSVDTDHGRFTLIAYGSVVDRLPHLAFCVGDVGRLDPSGHPLLCTEPTLVRMHRRDLLGDVFGDKSHPSNRVLAASLRRIQAEGHGVVVYLRPEGTGEEPAERLPTWIYPPLRVNDSVNEPDLTSAGGMGARAMPMDQREFGIGGQILSDLGLTRLRVLTNNPKRLHHLQAFGLEVVESVSVDL
ncbi:MAG: 3,4-dihydroxy-2-butanone-4-phosphate synthase [Candidatus Rokubacteria bacterium]|nr:3,4-dihydroxy-2-butanone-4-phosphate synthase [Candidatus Rokubacteria bacterium]